MKPKNVMILSGAGLSAESGLQTFRDNGGLWGNYDVMEICSASGFAKNPKKVLDFYDIRRKELQNAKPNLAHQILAKLKAKYNKQIFIITQNIDDLLEKAGCKDVIHLHGFLPQLRCLKCGKIFNIGYESIKNKHCPKCQSTNLRHNIVMFEEAAPEYKKLYTLLCQTSLFVALGTSGAVLPVGHYAECCKKSILCNLDDNTNLAGYFDKFYEGKITEQITKIQSDIEEFLSV